MTEEIEAHVLKKYEILQKLGKSDFSFVLCIISDAILSHFLKGEQFIVQAMTCFITKKGWTLC